MATTTKRRVNWPIFGMWLGLDVVIIGWFILNDAGILEWAMVVMVHCFAIPMGLVRYLYPDIRNPDHDW